MAWTAPHRGNGLSRLEEEIVYYNFRFDRRATAELLRRARDEKQLSQGWGGGDACALPLTDPDFVSNCTAHYGLASTRIPTNLTRIRDFKDGDVLVVPHLPEHAKVSLHVVEGDFPTCYSYVEGDATHLNHRVKLKCSYGLDGNISIYNVALAAWYGKLQWRRLPVLPIEEHAPAFSSVADTLARDPTARFDKSELTEFLDAAVADAVGAFRDRLAQVNPSRSDISFEAICEHLLTRASYTIDRRNVYDGKGGDVDRVCKRRRTERSPFESGEVTLFVQVKKHKGTTGRGAVDQLIAMMKKEPGADGCVMTLADGFSEEAVSLADDHGIVLMNGGTICRLLIGTMLEGL